MEFRLATSADIDAITETLTLAFLDDPVWGPALRRADGATEHLRPFWRVYAEGSVRLGSAYLVDGAALTDGAAAIALWTPPNEHELSDAQSEQLNDLMRASFAPAELAPLLELYERFDAAHPHDVPHAYLGLLATHPGHRGHGIAQQLMAANLAELDARGLPAYLESTNPANDHRYERAGFRPIGGYSAVLDDARVTTMWRQPHSV